MKFGFLPRPFHVPTRHFSLSTWGCGWARTRGQEGVGFSVGPRAPSTGSALDTGLKTSASLPVPGGLRPSPQMVRSPQRKEVLQEEAGRRVALWVGQPGKVSWG